MNQFSSIPAARYQQAQRQRTSQRDILPRVVKGRNIGSLIFVSEGATGATSLDNGVEAFAIPTTIQNKQRDIISNTYLAMYANSITGANLIPSGSNIDESQWQFSYNSYNLFTWENTYSFAKYVDTGWMYIRNISAGTTTVYFQIRTKYFSPFEDLTAGTA